MLQIFSIIFSAFLGLSPNAIKDMLPNAMVKDINGKELNIADYTKKDKVQLVNLWATWCGPCRMELRELHEAYGDLQKKYDLEIIAVTTDHPRSLKMAKKMFKDKGWQFTFMHDHKGELSRKLKVDGIPYSLIIDQKGEVVAVTRGFSPGYIPNLEKKIKELL